MENISVLKLDSSFNPIEVIDWRSAFILTWLNKAYVAEYTEKWIHSATQKFQVPEVIVLFKYIDKKFFTVPCTSKNVMIRDNHRCQYCGAAAGEKDLNVDHIVPRCKGGMTEWSNVVASCVGCNQKKGNLLLCETNLKLLKKPSKPTYRSLIRKKVGDTNIIWTRYL
jgi:5-methylcytosine-specific restriction endonuclease McrA